LTSLTRDEDFGPNMNMTSQAREQKVGPNINITSQTREHKHRMASLPRVDAYHLGQSFVELNGTGRG